MGYHSIVEIEWYFLICVLIFMVLAINKVLEMKKMDFLQISVFRDAVDEKLFKSKKSS